MWVYKSFLRLLLYVNAITKTFPHHSKAKYLNTSFFSLGVYVYIVTMYDISSESLIHKLSFGILFYMLPHYYIHSWAKTMKHAQIFVFSCQVFYYNKSIENRHISIKFCKQRAKLHDFTFYYLLWIGQILLVFFLCLMPFILTILKKSRYECIHTLQFRILIMIIVSKFITRWSVCVWLMMIIVSIFTTRWNVQCMCMAVI